MAKSEKIDMLGKRIGHWRVIAEDTIRTRDRKVKWICRCDCGRIVSVIGKDLRNGKSTQCDECGYVTHGECRNGKMSPEYLAYRNARNRCTKPNHQAYENYGGRGIEFRFRTFSEFLEEVGRKPHPALSLDRIDNEGHYEKGNIRWATAVEQNNNRRPSCTW